MTTYLNAYQTFYHDDGDVTVWDVFRQQWVRMPAADVSDALLATLPASERAAIAEHAARSGEVTP